MAKWLMAKSCSEHVLASACVFSLLAHWPSVQLCLHFILTGKSTVYTVVHTAAFRSYKLDKTLLSYSLDFGTDIWFWKGEGEGKALRV